MVRVSLVPCVLCGQRTPTPLKDDEGRDFCCPACREVFHLLQKAPPPEEPDTAQATGPSEEGVLALGGLWCRSCAFLVQRAIARTRGVREVRVSLLHGEARVVYDPTVTDLSRCARAVRRLGYRAWLPGQRRGDEEEALSFRLLALGVLAMHVMLISIALYLREWMGWSTPDTAWLDGFFRIILLMASTPIVLVLGLPVLRAGVGAILQGRPSMHTLIGIGAFSAYALSVRNMAVGSEQVFFDTASMLLVLVSLGHWFELRARKTAGSALKSPAEHLPATARVVDPEAVREVPLEQLRPGLRVRVGPGERVPVDGIVASGRAEVDESALTGEPSPVLKAPGARALAGTTVVEGQMDIVASAVGQDTLLGRTARDLREALWLQAPVERLADRVSAVMVPTALALAGATFGLWFLWAGAERALTTALAVLVVACPCALGLATPLALWVGVGRAGREGALVRHPGALEALARVRAFLLDKTGTLTRRSLRVVGLAVLDVSEEEAWEAIASAEAEREHPLARALTEEARRRGVAFVPLRDVRSIPGRGVEALVQGRQVLVGNARLLQEAGAAVPQALADRAIEWTRRGRGVVFLAMGGRAVAVVALEEQERPGARQAVQSLARLGLQVAVLTGDTQESALRWGERLGVPAEGGLTPSDKVRRVRHAPSPRAMVGDGVNDAPALATADVGISLSGGTDEARSASWVVLLREDLRLLPWLVGLSRDVMRRVRWNLAWAFLYNGLGIGVAVAGLLHPVVAAGAMALSSLLVTGNSLRLRRFPSP